MILYLRARQTLFVRDTCRGKYVLYGDEIFEMDDAAVAILRLCDGTNTLEEVIAGLSGQGSESAEIREAVTGFVDLMTLEGVLETVPERRPIEAVYANSHPCGAILEITYRCNMRCSFCVASAGSEQSPAGGELDPDEWDRVLDQLGEWAPSPVNITGGEPLLRPDLVMRMAQKARAVGLEPLLLTNATLIDDAMAQNLYDAGIREVQVSIDSPAAETHDASRGVTGAFRAARRGIDAMQKVGMEVSGAAVITRQNIDQISAIADCFRGYGSHTKISEVLPLGRGTSHPDLLSPEQLFRMQVFLCERGDGLLARSLFARETCSIGTTPAVTPYGDVYPCFSMRFPDFIIGNVRSQSIAAMWEESPALRQLTAWRIQDVEICRDCRNRLICGGGCRAIAHAYHGTIYKPDPYHCLASRRLTGELLKRGDERTRQTVLDLLNAGTHKDGQEVS